MTLCLIITNFSNILREYFSFDGRVISEAESKLACCLAVILRLWLTAIAYSLAIASKTEDSANLTSESISFITFSIFDKIISIIGFLSCIINAFFLIIIN